MDALWEHGCWMQTLEKHRKTQKPEDKTHQNTAYLQKTHTITPSMCKKHRRMPGKIRRAHLLYYAGSAAYAGGWLDKAFDSWVLQAIVQRSIAAANQHYPEAPW